MQNVCEIVFLRALCFMLISLSSTYSNAADTLHIGSKRFTESYILGEILKKTAVQSGTSADHSRGLGNTAIVFAALKTGSIDLYPEYLGTIDQEILKNATPSSLAEINQQLASVGLGVAIPLGFSNTYALAMNAIETRQSEIRTISDLKRLPGLKFGLSHEFLGRADGWPGMAQRYGIKQKPVGVDHGIAYEALSRRQFDVIDIYSTDARIAQLGLTVLEDDLHYFPRYDAVILYRLDVPRRFPAAWKALSNLQDHISVRQMIMMNAAVELDGKSFADAAENFLEGDTGRANQLSKRSVEHQNALTSGPKTSTAVTGIAIAPRNSVWNKTFDENLLRLTRQHLTLVLASVFLAALTGIPLGIAAASLPRLEQIVMGLVGVLQTIPALALLAMLIPIVGRIGTIPALIALFLYALLPIVRNTCTGLGHVPAGLRMAALALGLTTRQRLFHVDLPLAMPIILAGLKTAAVMSVGTATIAAFIGAGGYGERIAIGLALNDNATLLAGALPAAALALLTQLLFELIEWKMGKRLTSTNR
jgi:osmoprotectant transport system permease protein